MQIKQWFRRWAVRRLARLLSRENEERESRQLRATGWIFIGFGLIFAGMAVFDVQRPVWGRVFGALLGLAVTGLGYGLVQWSPRIALWYSNRLRNKVREKLEEREEMKTDSQHVSNEQKGE